MNTLRNEHSNHSAPAVFASIHANLYSQKQYNFVVDITVPDSEHNHELGK